MKDVVAYTKIETEGQPTRRLYIVKSEHGLFKNGEHYVAGNEVALDDSTAKNFLALKEIELKPEPKK